jgi:hypothetical protein
VRSNRDGIVSKNVIRGRPATIPVMVEAELQPRDPAADEEELISWITLLADEVGPRRPTSRRERLAAELFAERLRDRGLAPRLEPFRGYPTFGLPFGLTLATAVAPSLIAPRFRRTRSVLAALAGAALATEGSLVRTPLGDALSRRGSQNLIASIDARGPEARTLCLMAHLDSSRSGLLFHPRVVGQMGRWIALNSALVAATAAGEPLFGGSAAGRRGLAAARAVLAAGLAVLLERELRGVDVPGANDNASGCAVAGVLAGEIAAAGGAGSTRIVLCLTGCEEAGTLGAKNLLRGHDTEDWLFLNFDNVGGDGTLRYLSREGVISHWDADPGLVAAAADVAGRRPDLRMAAEDHPAGLTYDSSPVLARGGRALTLSIQDGFIPNLHLPTDTTENVDPDGVRRALEAGRELVAAIDGGAADPA